MRHAGSARRGWRAFGAAVAGGAMALGVMGLGVMGLGVMVLGAGLAGCASAGEGGPGVSRLGGRDRGTLLIVGGGLRDENAEVYGRFIELAGAGATIGVVPTATGEDPPGEDDVAVIRRYARGDQRVVLIPLTRDDASKANDAEIAAMIRGCRALWFVGGDQSRITRVFRPEPTRTSAAYEATLEVLAGGGVIAGTSAGAAMMSDPMITGGRSASALEHGATWTSDPGPEDGVGLAPGMGYVPGHMGVVIVDQHFTQRDRFGRLWVAMGEASARAGVAGAMGLGVPEDSAVEVDRRTGRMRWWGAEAVVWMRSVPRGSGVE